MHSMSYLLVDLLIYLWLFGIASEGLKKGAYRSAMEFLALSGSLFIGLTYYNIISGGISKIFNLPNGISNLAGFTIIMLTFIFLFFILTEFIAERLHEKIKNVKNTKWFKWTGASIEATKGLIIASLVLAVLAFFPINIYTKKLVLNSPTGSYLASKVSFIELSLKEVFARPIEEGIFFKAVSAARSSAPPKPGKPPPRYLMRLPSEEMALFEIINLERKKADIELLVFDEKISNIAADHSLDMFKKNYFSHTSPDHLDVGNRLTDNGIIFKYAGENIAIAGNIKTAHHGLMKSEGHRLNILDPNFKKVGIGIIDAGPFQQMITQNFTD